MSRAGHILFALMTCGWVAIGAWFGYFHAIPRSPPWTGAATGTLVGFILAVFARSFIAETVPQIWAARSRILQAALMIVQGGCTAFGLYIGCTVQDATHSRPVWVVLETGLGFFLGLTITVVWALIYEALRYGFPALIGRAVQKVHGQHPLRP